MKKDWKNKRSLSPVTDICKESDPELNKVKGEHLARCWHNNKVKRTGCIDFSDYGLTHKKMLPKDYWHSLTSHYPVDRL